MIHTRWVNLIPFFLIAYCLPLQLSAQKLLSGPMMGHHSENTVYLWLLVKDTKQIDLTLRDSVTGERFDLSAKTDTCFSRKNKSTCRFAFSNLPAGTAFVPELKLDGIPVPCAARIFTLKAERYTDFSFLAGSCMLLPPKILNPLYPGIQDRICNYMTPHAGDFMLWLGDYLYYRPRDVRTPLTMFNKQVKKRTNKRLERFHRKCGGNYAIWDDHDFGPNNSNSRFRLKDESLQLHQSFWANPYFGTDSLPGTYSHFSHYDTDFFLLDDRLHRTLPAEKNATILQEKQVNWLLNRLKSSNATFKFVVIGTQFITEMSTGEHHYEYPEERNRIIRFIMENNISGVIFLSGDMHYTELLKLQKNIEYPLYELTSSPMTSVVYKTPIRNNPLNVGNSLTFYRNFSDIRIHGQPSDRICTIITRDEFGRPIWEYSIHANELKVK